MLIFHLKGALFLRQFRFITLLLITGALVLTACSADNVFKKKTEEDDTSEHQKEEKNKNTEGKSNDSDKVNEAKDDKDLDEDVEVNASGTKVVDDPTDILVLVNKQHALPDGFEPTDLVFPNVRFPFTEDLPKKQMRKVAATALEEMFEAGDKAGVNLFGQSGYRSYERQVAIFAANVEKNGEEAANNYSARPGESEHQTGLTMDVTSADANYELTTEFGDTEEGQWLEKNAADFGFIIRYPKDKEAITEYQYEPWHIRYVGKDVAKEIMSKKITLEEYLGVK